MFPPTLNLFGTPNAKIKMIGRDQHRPQFSYSSPRNGSDSCQPVELDSTMRILGNQWGLQIRPKIQKWKTNTEDPFQLIKPPSSSNWSAGITSDTWWDLATTNRSHRRWCGRTVDSRSKVQINFSINFRRRHFRFQSWFTRYVKRVQATHKQTPSKACSINWITKRPLLPRSHHDPRQREFESLLRNNNLSIVKSPIIRTPMTTGAKELPQFIKWETHNLIMTKV